MGKTAENPRYNVISVRLNDEEHEKLKKLAEKREKTVGEVVRDQLFRPGRVKL